MLSQPLPISPSDSRYGIPNIVRNSPPDVRSRKHGSWLNAAEIGLAILSSQCLDRRLADIETLQTEITAWEETRN